MVGWKQKARRPLAMPSPRAKAGAAARERAAVSPDLCYDVDLERHHINKGGRVSVRVRVRGRTRASRSGRACAVSIVRAAARGPLARRGVHGTALVMRESPPPSHRPNTLDWD